MQWNESGSCWRSICQSAAKTDNRTPPCTVNSQKKKKGKKSIIKQKYVCPVFPDLLISVGAFDHTPESIHESVPYVPFCLQHVTTVAESILTIFFFIHLAGSNH